MREIVEPTMAGMAAAGAPYVGFLYAGLMIAADGTPKVIEFNCRFGDPEAQPVLMRLKSDLAILLQAALTADLEGMALDWDPRAALGVVMASGGYPGSYAKGATIGGLDQLQDADVKAFHAGTQMRGAEVVTNGGRVLCVVGLGERVSDAQRKAYQGVDRITWQDAQYRTDIGYRAIARESR
jgi:phosphoribosylamine--glycine ligase